jgi:hypothetical protein
MADARNEQTFTELLRGIVDDIRDLFRQEIALARYEIREEISKARSAALLFAAAGAALAIGGGLLILALGRVIAVLFNWPVWAGYGLLGLLFAIGGLVALSMAQGRLRRVNAIPPETAKSVKENVEWVKGQTRSDRT